MEWGLRFSFTDEETRAQRKFKNQSKNDSPTQTPQGSKSQNIWLPFSQVGKIAVEVPCGDCLGPQGTASCVPGAHSPRLCLHYSELLPFPELLLSLRYYDRGFLMRHLMQSHNDPCVEETGPEVRHLTGSTSHSMSVPQTARGWGLPETLAVGKRRSQPLNTGGASPGMRGVHGSGREGKLACRPGWGGCWPGDPPLNELLHHFHPRIELVQGKDVLLSKQPQSRALPEVLQRE